MQARRKPNNVTLTVKNVPRETANALKKRAEKHRRSLQGELLTILEAAASRHPRPLTVDQLYERVQQLGFGKRSEAVALVRELRDGG